jgi:predicted Zn-dependent protease
MNPWPARHAARRFFSGPSSRLSLGQGGYNKYRGQPPGNGGLPLYIWIAAGGTTAVIGYGYFAFLDEAPLTKRKRWLAISPAWEQQMGDEQYQQLLQAFRNDILPPDHRAAVTVRRVGSRIAQASTEFCQEHCLPVASTGAVTAGASSYTYTVVRSDTANAFVLPGRHIFVMTGLFDHVHNEDELAAVLGHEIAHNVARHAGEKVSGSLAVNLLARLSLLVDPSGVLFSVILPAANVLRELP